MTTTIRVYNVNDALHVAMSMVKSAMDVGLDNSDWRKKAPRGMPTLEHKGVVITEYECPTQRVLFDETRDANPFFHFFEALWILDGRDDVEFLAQFNSNMRNFSDDGRVFHAPYGYRLRKHFQHPACTGAPPGQCYDAKAVDQLFEVVELLKKEPDTRRAVMCIWDPVKDLNVQSRDLPCNDMIMFSINEDKLEVEVVCRSNDVIWGAYGANAVQFRFLQEFVARAVGVQVGMLSQISRSFHFYSENDTFQKLLAKNYGGRKLNPYARHGVSPYPLMADDMDYKEWLDQLHDFLLEGCLAPAGLRYDAFFTDVAAPMARAWQRWKDTDYDKDERIVLAQQELIRCRASDWRLACHEWLERRREVQ
jgi:thymidylate synthase